MSQDTRLQSMIALSLRLPTALKIWAGSLDYPVHNKTKSSEVASTNTQINKCQHQRQYLVFTEGNQTRNLSCHLPPPLPPLPPNNSDGEVTPVSPLVTVPGTSQVTNNPTSSSLLRPTAPAFIPTSTNDAISSHLYSTSFAYPIVPSPEVVPSTRTCRKRPPPPPPPSNQDEVLEARQLRRIFRKTMKSGKIKGDGKTWQFEDATKLAPKLDWKGLRGLAQPEDQSQAGVKGKDKATGKGKEQEKKPVVKKPVPVGAQTVAQRRALEKAAKEAPVFEEGQTGVAASTCDFHLGKAFPLRASFLMLLSSSVQSFVTPTPPTTPYSEPDIPPHPTNLFPATPSSSSSLPLSTLSSTPPSTPPHPEDWRYYRPEVLKTPIVNGLKILYLVCKAQIQFGGACLNNYSKAASA